MILFCEFNPTLRKEYRVVDFEKNKVNTFSENFEYPTGEILDSMLLVDKLSANSTLLTYLGGKTGELFKNELNKRGITPVIVHSKDESMEEILIRSRSLKTTIRGEYPVLTNDEEETLFSKFNELLQNANIVLIAAKGNPNIDSTLYKNFFNLCYKNGVRVLTAPNEIEDVIDVKPYLMVVDKEDLENYTNFIIKTQSQVVKASNIIFEKGVGVLVVNSQTGVMVNTKGASYRVDFNDLKYSVSKFDKNKLNAGIALGIERGYDFEMTLKLGIACAIIESAVKNREAEMADLKALMNDIHVHIIRGEM
ncbi:MAG: PfkB family carbohydrate kinase [Peptoniphilus sp.]|uniref:PfkB family carbohydrate kinase n=1 Tax=Peptoniphilus sp. TaxID=1971214 RepID=UPI002A750069|nr:PfkB family carbohydrate kinase [Peptoniphilus sp.]MDY2986537.1 PfkB family carbohydrate kinase [Peptoniphilus sp.]